MQRYNKAPRIEIKLAEHIADPGNWRLNMSTRRLSSSAVPGTRETVLPGAAGDPSVTPASSFGSCCRQYARASEAQGPDATLVFGPCAASLGRPSMLNNGVALGRVSGMRSVGRGFVARSSSTGDELSVPRPPFQIRSGHHHSSFSPSGTGNPRPRKNENRICVWMKREGEWATPECAYDEPGCGGGKLQRRFTMVVVER